MIPGASVSDVAYLQGPSGVVPSITPVSGSLLVDGSFAGALISSLRADGGYLIRGTIPVTATPGQSVSMQYVMDHGNGPGSKTVFLGQVRAPGSTLHPTAQVPFEIRANGVLITPDTSVTAILNCSGVEVSVPVSVVSTGSYVASVAYMGPEKSYELIVCIEDQGLVRYQTVRLYPSVDAQIVVEDVTVFQLPDLPQGRIQRTSPSKIRIAPVRRTTLRVKT